MKTKLIFAGAIALASVSNSQVLGVVPLLESVTLQVQFVLVAVQIQEQEQHSM